MPSSSEPKYPHEVPGTTITEEGWVLPATFSSLTEEEKSRFCIKFDLTAGQLELLADATDSVASGWVMADVARDLYRSADVRKVSKAALDLIDALMAVDSSRRFALLDTLEALNAVWRDPAEWPGQRQRAAVEALKRMGRASKVQEATVRATDKLLEGWKACTRREPTMGENGKAASRFFHEFFPLMRLRGPRTLFKKGEIPGKRIKDFGAAIEKELLNGVERRQSAQGKKGRNKP